MRIFLFLSETLPSIFFTFCIIIEGNTGHFLALVSVVLISCFIIERVRFYLLDFSSNGPSDFVHYCREKCSASFQPDCYFGPWVYPIGSIEIALVSPLVCWSVCLSVRLSAFKYLGDRSLVFSEILHEVSGQ